MNKSNIWSPTSESIDKSQIIDFIKLINHNYQTNIESYKDLHLWSIENIKNFWEEVLFFSKIKYFGNYKEVVDNLDQMPGAKWFKGISLNYSENLLKKRNSDIAIEFYSESGTKKTVTYKKLFKNVSSVSMYLKEIGIKPGDRVSAVISNIPEAIVLMLGCASIGAVWTSCSPDFGEDAIVDRFEQVKPTVLIGIDGYIFKGKYFSVQDKIYNISKSLSSIKHIITIDFINSFHPNRLKVDSVSYSDIVSNNAESIDFTPLPFDHPLYIMYSSGTTGKPKSIVHSSGGTLIQHIKELMLHLDLKEKEKIFYFTTCGWMMWNWLVSSLYCGSTVILFDGSPFYPSNDSLLKVAEKESFNIFGTSAKYIDTIEKKGIKPSSVGKYTALRSILSTGSPLQEDNFDFVYNNWKHDVQLSSISGGTDIISCFVLGCPILPVKRGEIQCIGLGMDVHSYDSKGNSVLDKKGELICAKPFPSMPIYFWNDSSGDIYKNAYFNKYKNVWTHGDYISVSSSGGIEIHGRSDATLNPGGVRIGTSEIYKVIEKFRRVEDSVAIGLEIDGDEKIILFVKMKEILSDELCNQIRNQIKNICSPRHIPYKIIKVSDIPYTLNGKKVEIAIKQVINKEEVLNASSIVNPESLNIFKNISI